MKKEKEKIVLLHPICHDGTMIQQNSGLCTINPTHLEIQMSLHLVIVNYDLLKHEP